MSETRFSISTYDWTPDTEDKMLRITKSSIGTFNWCPKQYQFEKMQRLPSLTQDHHIRGVNLHNSLEGFYKRAPEYIPAILEAAGEGLMQKALGLTIKAFPPAQELERHEEDDAQNTPIYKHGEKDGIAKLAEWELDRLIITQGEDFLPVGNEEWVEVQTELEVDGVIVPVHICGFIDRIFRDENGGLALMELKSGKWKGSKTSSMRQELAVYKFLLDEIRKTPEGKEALRERGLDAPVTHWGWRFPMGGINNGEGPHWHYEPVKKQSMNAMMRKMKAVVRAHLKQEFKAAADAFKCSFCDQMAYCPAWMTVGGDV